MSAGISAYDFVQEVYLWQEGVILDYRPGDDRYKKVLMVANSLIETDLQSNTDWIWLRENLVLGPCGPTLSIPEFRFPDWVFKPCCQLNDFVKLYREHHGHLVRQEAIDVPWASTSRINDLVDKRKGSFAALVDTQPHLLAINMDSFMTFNRPFNDYEAARIASCDVIKRIKLFDVNDPDGTKVYLKEVPIPKYLAVLTASVTCQDSPPAAAKQTLLETRAKSISSDMQRMGEQHNTPDVTRPASMHIRYV